MHFLHRQKYFIIIFIAGTTLRCIDLTGESIWVDEGRSTVIILERYVGPEDLVVVHSGFCIANAIDFYRRREDMNFLPFPPQHLQITPQDSTLLAEKTAAFHRIWLVKSHSRDSTDQILSVLDQDFKCRRLVYLPNRSFNSHKSYSGVEISVWDKKDAYKSMSLPEVRY